MFSDPEGRFPTRLPGIFIAWNALLSQDVLS